MVLYLCLRLVAHECFGINQLEIRAEQMLYSTDRNHNLNRPIRLLSDFAENC
jgi:hypothetical protein